MRAKGGLAGKRAGRGNDRGRPFFIQRWGAVLAAYLRANRQKFKALFQDAGIPPADVEYFFWSVVEEIDDAEWKETTDPGALLFSTLTRRVEAELAIKQLWNDLTQMSGPKTRQRTGNADGQEG